MTNSRNNQTQRRLDPLVQLRKCCNYNMYRIKLKGSTTEIETEPATCVTISEETFSGGEKSFVHRVILKNEDGRGPFTCKYTGGINGGWVVNRDIKQCMSEKCSNYFGLFCWKHHCRCCGNLVCSDCSPKRVDLLEELGLTEVGKSRVCSKCYKDLHFKPHMSNMSHSEAAAHTLVQVVKEEEREQKDLRAPTPAKADQSKLGQQQKEEVAVAALGTKSILKKTKVNSEAKIKSVDAMSSEAIESAETPESIANILNNLNGRWDRSDDGISTPGSIYSDLEAEKSAQGISPATQASDLTSVTSGMSPVFPVNEHARGTPGSDVTSSSFASSYLAVTPSYTGDGKRPFLQNGALTDITNSSKSSGRHKTPGTATTTNSDKSKYFFTPGSTTTDSSAPNCAMTDHSKPEKKRGDKKCRKLREEIEKESNAPKFVPVPSFVIEAQCPQLMLDKSHLYTVSNDDIAGSEKRSIFINVCKHNAVPKPVSKQSLRRDKIGAPYCIGSMLTVSADTMCIVNENDPDSSINGESMLVVDVCYHSSVLDWAYSDVNGGKLGALAEHAVISVNKAHQLNAWIVGLPSYTTYYGHVKAMPLEPAVDGAIRLPVNARMK